jgi:hypothetical protein
MIRLANRRLVRVSVVCNDWRQEKRNSGCERSQGEQCSF